MNIYHYANDTGEYVGSTLARVVPGREEWADGDQGKFLCPASATFQPPPQVPQGSVAVFVEGSWQAAEDHRGNTGFVEGSPTVITSLGPLPEGWSTTPPVTPPLPLVVTPLQARRALRAAGLIEQVNAAISAADADTQDAWEYATVIERDNAIIAAMAVQLGLTEQDVDGLFALAVTL